MASNNWTQIQEVQFLELLEKRTNYFKNAEEELQQAIGYHLENKITVKFLKDNAEQLRKFLKPFDESARRMEK